MRASNSNSTFTQPSIERMDIHQPYAQYRLPKENNGFKRPLSSILEDPNINLITPLEPINIGIDTQEATADKEGIQPIHTVWLGGNLTDKQRFDNLEKLKKLNPNTEIILWVHQIHEPITKDNPMVVKCQELGVHVIPIEKVFEQHLPFNSQFPELSKIDIWQLHMEGMLKASYGWTSDIDRYIYLYMYGGIHVDLDTEPKKKLEDIDISSGFYLTEKKYNEVYNNDPLAANKHCSELANAIINVNNQAKKPFSELFTELIHNNGLNKFRIPYEKTYHQLDQNSPSTHYANVMDLIYLQTIKTTGSWALVDQFEFPKQDIPRRNIFPSGYFIANNGNAWLNTSLLTRHFQGTSEQALVIIIANILSDLKREPRYLHIDRYAELIKHCGIGDKILTTLSQPPLTEALKSVEYVSCLESIHDAPSINMLFDKSIFPNLHLNQEKNLYGEELDYYIQRITTNPNLELLKILHEKSLIGNYDANEILTACFKRNSDNSHLQVATFILDNISSDYDLIELMEVTIAEFNLKGFMFLYDKITRHNDDNLIAKLKTAIDNSLLESIRNHLSLKSRHTIERIDALPHVIMNLYAAKHLSFKDVCNLLVDIIPYEKQFCEIATAINDRHSLTSNKSMFLSLLETAVLNGANQSVNVLLSMHNQMIPLNETITNIKNELHYIQDPTKKEQVEKLLQHLIEFNTTKQSALPFKLSTSADTLFNVNNSTNKESSSYQNNNNNSNDSTNNSFKT